MLNFQFAFDHHNKIEQKLIKQRNGKLLIDIQGRLEVIINNRIYFLEPSLALLEFAISLHKWNRGENYYYYTMEHDEREGPLLAFMKNTKNQWSLFSIWQLYKSDELLTLEMIEDAVDDFLHQFDAELLRYYGFRINDFIRNKR
ncbi:DUF7878 domain-containing protein [Ornithinibacillus halotolerans]|uniref:DUF7878 domain-containing protein n=1 Tax=Ornithinibacillus halotolerans TaxID=1274357 RepID=A0A916W9N7_9BACI|nr:hypothetical protein [Ornithinibacillus halotolerans]GGA78500.1 hypothetical protein GCM10008025_22470 [Ornithinibacillus halotolerans]